MATLQLYSLKDAGFAGVEENEKGHKEKKMIPLPRVRKLNPHSDRGQDSNPCAWSPLGPHSTHGSTVPRRLLLPITQIVFVTFTGGEVANEVASGVTGEP
ncbi:hypothetical protein E2C01_090801 [Portunus trituberculatus]|uniref:Uncharacterized protein n=1 Tax=Portunus trituberculatus TaxID=210409 RepID=A0A5B7JMC2_PORTR|nr:hypothetical protein [Portunus trituberculatus]